MNAFSPFISFARKRLFAFVGIHINNGQFITMLSSHLFRPSWYSIWADRKANEFQQTQQNVFVNLENKTLNSKIKTQNKWKCFTPKPDCRHLKMVLMFCLAIVAKTVQYIVSICYELWAYSSNKKESFNNNNICKEQLPRLNLFF